MARLASRTTLLIAATLVAVAQVVVAPATCCLLRSALADAPCCGVAKAASAEAALPPCCRRPAAPSASERGASADAPRPVRPERCLWCSADPKLAASDRAEMPDPLRAWAFAAVPATPVPAVVPTTTEPAADRGPPPPTAPDRCARLCVWLI